VTQDSGGGVAHDREEGVTLYRGEGLTEYRGGRIGAKGSLTILAKRWLRIGTKE
jgi:hypothetical protein